MKGKQVSEEKLREDLANLEIYQAQLEGLSRQQELLRISLEEHYRARETMTRYRDTKEAKEGEILIPIGGNSFLFARVGDITRAIVGIGSEVMLEEKIGVAIEKIDKRIKKIEEAGQKIGEKIAEINERTAGLSQKIQREYRDIQEKMVG